MKPQLLSTLVLVTLVLSEVTGCAGQRPRRVNATGGVIEVRAGDNLQTAIDAAQPGDTIVVQAGVVYTGPFTLPRKTGDQFITIRTAALESLPKEGIRVTPGDAPLMPKIVSPGGGVAAISTAPGAHHYRFIGIEFKTRDAKAFSYSLISLGGDAVASVSEQAHHLVFDRCYIHSEGPARRGIALNSGETSILNSYISGFKEEGADSQAVCGWNGPGPFHIVNNYLEGAGENILFGGSDPSIPNLVPSDIEIRGNHIAKPLSWRNSKWTVKNLLELKNARRVVIEENLIENTWLAGQSGTAVLFTPRNQDGKADWSVVREVVFRNNIVRHAVNAISLLAVDYIHPSQTTASIRISNNLFYDIDGGAWGNGGGGILLMLSGPGATGLELSHNTAVHTGSCIQFEDGSSVTGLNISNNIMRFHILGGGSAGTEALERYAKGQVVVQNNAIVLDQQRDYWMERYPSKNLFPEGYFNVGFTNVAAGDYGLRVSSPMKHKASDKSDMGVDFGQLAAAKAGGS